VIKKADKSDIKNIIDLHLTSFNKNHFSAVFTKEMLERYFENLLELNDFNLVFYDDEHNELLGYVIAGYSSKEAVNKFIRENYFTVILTLIKNPRFLSEKIHEVSEKILGTKYSKKAKCRLYLIAVNQNYKGKGIGKQLINFLENELRKKGLNIYGLSVRKDNKDAIGFYNQNGYKVEFENSKSIFYKKEI
jgi:ribosomal protein S18 acetylase RimI-like enzyme